MSAHDPANAVFNAINALSFGKRLPPDTCPRCDGLGFIYSPDPWFPSTYPCPDCDGEGVMAQEPEPSPEERAVVESRLAAWDERHSAGIEDIDYPEAE